MNNKLFLLMLVLVPLAHYTHTKLYICTHHSKHASVVIDFLHKSNITFELVESMPDAHKDDKNLYIIFDIFNVDQQFLPKYYITYQTLDLNNYYLTSGYSNKLLNSVAIWDYSPDNINKYRSKIHNYLYMPCNYEYADAVVLSCLLPLNALDSYKELLIYSNQKDTDISSHLPALFCHTLLQKPQIIVEAGVRGGESTKPLYKAGQFYKAQLIGIDIEPLWAQSSYNAMNNALCLQMNDLDFGNYYHNSSFKDKKIDIVFIDTYHQYQHTLQEIELFEPLLSEHGTLMFHDSNVTPLENAGYIRLNFTLDHAGGNTRGVTQAIKEYFELEFDEYAYCNFVFTKDETSWNLIHYPFCNGLTIMRKIDKN